MNRCYIQSTIFVDLHKDSEVDRAYGFRIFDDEGKSYINHMSRTVFYNLRAEGPKKILEYFMECGDQMAYDIADFAMFVKGGVYYDGDWHDVEVE